MELVEIAKAAEKAAKDGEAAVAKAVAEVEKASNLHYRQAEAEAAAIVHYLTVPIGQKGEVIADLIRSGKAIGKDTKARKAARADFVREAFAEAYGYEPDADVKANTVLDKIRTIAKAFATHPDTRSAIVSRIDSAKDAEGMVGAVANFIGSDFTVGEGDQARPLESRRMRLNWSRPAKSNRDRLASAIAAYIKAEKPSVGDMLTLVADIVSEIFAASAAKAEASKAESKAAKAAKAKANKA
jgi:hypothetical protein